MLIWLEKISDGVISFVVVTLGGALIWLVKTIFTNQKQIEMLKKNLENFKADIELGTKDRRENQAAIQSAISTGFDKLEIKIEKIDVANRAEFHDVNDKLMRLFHEKQDR